MKYVIPTQFALHIADRLQSKGYKIIYPLKNRDNKFYHPDGTFYTRIPEAEKISDALVIHSGARQPNDGNVELDFILSILKRNSVNFEVFFLYYPYGRQDHISESGETAYAEDFANSIFWRGAKKIYAVDGHFSKQSWVGKYLIENISANSLIRQRIDDPNAVFLSPDVGAGKRFDIPSMSKVRHDSYQVEISSPEELSNIVKGKHAVVLDDIISTGRTMVKAGENLRKMGVSKISAAATHGVLEEGLRLVHDAFDGNLYVTNTVNSPLSNVDITPLVEEVFV